MKEQKVWNKMEMKELMEKRMRDISELVKRKAGELGGESKDRGKHIGGFEREGEQRTRAERVTDTENGK